VAQAGNFGQVPARVLDFLRPTIFLAAGVVSATFTPDAKFGNALNTGLEVRLRSVGLTGGAGLLIPWRRVVRSFGEQACALFAAGVNALGAVPSGDRKPR